MKIAERRALVEILLCGARSGCLFSAYHLGHPRRLGVTAYKYRDKVLWKHGLLAVDSAIEAAYRLIEASPTLVREYFGKEQSP